MTRVQFTTRCAAVTFFWAAAVSVPAAAASTVHAAAATTAGFATKALRLSQGAPAQPTPAPRAPASEPAPRSPGTARPAPPAVVMGTEVRPDTPQQPQPAMARGNQPPAMANVQLDLVITDTISGTPTKKTVTMLVRSGGSGSIRTSGNATLPTGRVVPVQLNLDAHASAIGEDYVQVGVTFEYQPAASQASESPGTPQANTLQESLNVVLRSGRPLRVSQSADPATERTVTVDLTATYQRE